MSPRSSLARRHVFFGTRKTGTVADEWRETKRFNAKDTNTSHLVQRLLSRISKKRRALRSHIMPYLPRRLTSMLHGMARR